MILLIIMIALNILICYMHYSNRVFPILFMLSEIVYGLSILEESELFIILIILFCVIYNMFIIIEQNRRLKRR